MRKMHQILSEDKCLSFQADKEKSRRLLKQLREAQQKLEQEKKRQALVMKMKKERAKSRKVNPDISTPRDVELDCDSSSVPENWIMFQMFEEKTRNT